jgi:hypothetical protein
MEEFHILKEVSSGSGSYTETGEIIATNETDAKLRCIELAEDGNRYGFMVYNSVLGRHVLPPGGVGVADPNLPSNVDIPVVSQNGAVLTCTMGNWTNTPTSYSYQWQVDGVTKGTNAATYSVQPGDVGHEASCTVTATNATGSTAAPASNSVVVT